MLCQMRTPFRMLFGKLFLVAFLCGLVLAGPSQALSTDTLNVADEICSLDSGIAGGADFGAHVFDGLQVARPEQEYELCFHIIVRSMHSSAVPILKATGPPHRLISISAH